MIKIISMPHSSRRDLVTERAERYNLKGWEFFNALPISDLSHFDFDTSRTIYSEAVTSHEISCCLSHYRCISDESTHAIFEDDFKFLAVPPLYDLVAELNKLKKPVVLILGHAKTSPRDFWIQKLKQPLINRSKICGFDVGENYRINFYGAVGYVFNNEFKKKMKDVRSPFWRADDWLQISKMSGAVILQVREKFVIEDIDERYVSSLNNVVHYRHDTNDKLIINCLKAVRAQLIYLLHKRYFRK